MSLVTTPPPTSISPAPSPTELPQYSISMPTKTLTRPIYLIVATTTNPPLGIGFNGSLPWGPLRADMAFFRRVTIESRPKPMNATSLPMLNTVIMGRKTWESIPQRSRPLKDRLNFILKRTDIGKFANEVVEEIRAKPAPKVTSTSSPTAKALISNPPKPGPHVEPTNGDPVSVSSFADPTTPVSVALSIEQALKMCSMPQFLSNNEADSNLRAPTDYEVGNVFVIGGAEIYRAALSEIPQDNAVRILQTQVRRRDGNAIECDTFFSEKLEGSKLWKEVSKEDVEQWVGTHVPQGEEEWKIDGDMEIRVVGWERITS